MFQCFHCLNEILRGIGFQQISPDARFENIAQQSLIVVLGKYQDLGLRAVQPDLPGRFNTIDEGQGVVEDCDFGLGQPRLFDSVASIGCFADDLPAIPSSTGSPSRLAGRSHGRPQSEFVS